MQSQAGDNDEVPRSLGEWALKTVLDARSLLSEARRTNANSSVYNEVSARLACVLEEVPDLWEELGEELMQTIWLGSDAAIQAHLAERAAGSLLAVGSGIKPRNLAELLCLVGRALAEERRYCAAFAILRRAHRVANAVGSRDLTFSALLDLRSRALQSWHFHMLNDGPRNLAFAAAIEDALKELSTRPKTSEEHFTCLDIGTGTGFLALVCWQLSREMPAPFQSKLKIHACEENELLFALASDIIDGKSSQRNHSQRWDTLGCLSSSQATSNKVQLHRTHSQHLQVPPVDLIFCEAVDAELLGEGFLRTALDACERLLKPNGILIPFSAKLFGQLVYCPSLCKRFSACGTFRVGARLREEFVTDFLQNLQHKVLSNPTEMLHIPFREPKALRQMLFTCESKTGFEALQTGTAHAVVVWWELYLDKLGRYKVSSHPGRQENHWPQVFWPLWGACQELPQLGVHLAASDELQVSVQIFEDRLECKQDGLPCQIQSSVVKVSQEDLLWLNDNFVWECLKSQHRAAPHPLGDVCVLDGSALNFPVAFLVASSALDRLPVAHLAALGRDPESAEAFLQHNGFSGKPALKAGSFADLLEVALSTKASLILLVADLVRRSGEIGVETLSKVCAAHRSCSAVGQRLTVLPMHLQLRLTAIESPALARRSQVLRPFALSSGASIDVGKLNLLKPYTFDSLSQETLAPRQLTPSQVVLGLSLSNPSLEENLKAINGQKFRLGPATCTGRVHGILCEWSWCLPAQNGQCVVQEFPQFDKAGALWPNEESLSEIRCGEFITVEVRAEERGIFILPHRIHKAESSPEPPLKQPWRSSKWLAWQRRRRESKECSNES